MRSLALAAFVVLGAVGAASEASAQSQYPGQPFGFTSGGTSIATLGGLFLRLDMTNATSIADPASVTVGLGYGPDNFPGFAAFDVLHLIDIDPNGGDLNLDAYYEILATGALTVTASAGNPVSYIRCGLKSHANDDTCQFWADNGTAAAYGGAGTTATRPLYSHTCGADDCEHDGMYFPTGPHRVGLATNGVAKWLIDGTATNMATLSMPMTLTAGSLSSSGLALNLTGTLGAVTGSNSSHGVDWTLTSSGSGGSQLGAAFVMGAGYTGTRNADTLEVVNAAAGTGNNLNLGSSFAEAFGNGGFTSFSTGTTTGLNYAGQCEALGGNLNIGCLAKATTAKNSATNIGIAAFGLNTGTTPVQIGGYFGLLGSTPTFASGALVADNGTTTDPILRMRDGNTDVFTVEDGGHLKSSGDAVSDAGTGTCTSVTVSGSATAFSVVATCSVIGRTVVVNLPGAYASAPLCTLGNVNANAATDNFTILPTTTTVTLTSTGAAAGSATVHVICIE